MPALVFEVSVSRTGGLLAASFTMTCGSIAVTSIPQAWARICGCAGTLFFAACTIAISRTLFRFGPQVIFDEEGIHDKRSGMVFRWNEIRRLAISEVHSQRLLSIFLNNEEERVSRLPKGTQKVCWLNQAMGLPAFNVSFSGLSPNLDQAFDYLVQHHPDKVLVDFEPPGQAVLP